MIDSNCGCIGTVRLQPTYNSRNSMEAFRQEAVRRARTLYLPDKSGTLVFELSDSAPASAIALVMEHRPAENKQYQIELQKGQRTSRILPVGGYTVVAFAKGFKPHRAYVEVVANQVTGVCVNLDEPPTNPPSLVERLSRYGLKLPPSGSARDLNVEEGSSVTLDPSSQSFASDVQTVKIGNIDDAKKILGHPNAYWPGERPRYGKMVDQTPSNIAETRDEGNLQLEARFALREYIYGNSQAVAGWAKYLDEYLSRNALDYPIFLFHDITVGPFGILYIGPSGLLCNALNVHYTAKVIVTGAGPTSIDVFTYNQYGYLEELPIAPIAFVNV